MPLRRIWSRAVACASVCAALSSSAAIAAPLKVDINNTSLTSGATYHTIVTSQADGFLSTASVDNVSPVP